MTTHLRHAGWRVDSNLFRRDIYAASYEEEFCVGYILSRGPFISGFFAFWIESSICGQCGPKVTGWKRTECLGNCLWRLLATCVHLIVTCHRSDSDIRLPLSKWVSHESLSYLSLVANVFSKFWDAWQKRVILISFYELFPAPNSNKRRPCRWPRHCNSSQIWPSKPAWVTLQHPLLKCQPGFKRTLWPKTCWMGTEMRIYAHAYIYN